MDWNNKLTLIVDYVENHLQRTEEEIDTDEIAKIAECSFDFFQKVFSYMNKISFSEYVRARKLTLAGYELKSSPIKIIDLAYKYGYDSPTSFTKAFSKFHGVSPTEARENQTSLVVYPKMKINVNEKYSWSLQTKPSFRLIGKMTILSCENNQHFEKIPGFWSQCFRDGTFSKLLSLNDGSINGVFGLTVDFNYEENSLTYAIMTNSTTLNLDSFEELILPEHTWAVFDCYGAIPKAIQDGWRYLNEEWIIQYPFKHAESPELEWYGEGNTFSDSYHSQIWIPILKDE
ncbi:hypothetical protein SDC9_145735 [bioreactor metagenome]|uniref:HTH araC/xylS-type domain-containing protein n=1 Tax=bioreactor metagenome TaxID=1076179 RepID=A0A645E9E6_9ZZZZ